MNSEICVKYNLELQSCNIDTVTQLLKALIPDFVEEVVNCILLDSGQKHLEEKTMPHTCCGDKNFTWSHKEGKATNLQTQWGMIKIPQLQIICKKCRGQKSMARPLLEMKERTQLPQNLKENIALFGSLMTYRVCNKVLGFTGVKISRSQAWRCVQDVGEGMSFQLHPDGHKSGMADGTGVGIQGIAKRGKELKVFAQDMPGGKLHLAGVSIGPYENEQNWREIFEPLKEEFEEMGEFHLTLDGDCNVIKGFDAEIELSIQRCLWHIPHQFKHYLWMDGIKHKSKEWLQIMSKIIRFVSLPKQKIDDKKLIDKMLQDKKAEYDLLCTFLTENCGFNCLSHLNNAYPNMFTNFKKQWKGKTTSLIERLMRTVNLRINQGKWSTKGALNAIKIRLAHYYNGWKPRLRAKEFFIKKLSIGGCAPLAKSGFGRSPIKEIGQLQRSLE